MEISETLNRDEAPAPKKGSARRKGADYSIGYCKPPPGFPKGKSGNPKGRPKKVEIVEGGNAAAQGPSVQDMFAAEFYRPVRVRRGEGADELPMIQAAFREVGMKAAKGNRLALATMAQLYVKLGVDEPEAVEPEPFDRAGLMAAIRARDILAEDSMSATPHPAAESATCVPENPAGEEVRLRVEAEAAQRVEEEVARRVDEEVQRRISEEVEQRVEVEVRARMAAVEEALAYKRIWQAAIEVAERIGFEMEAPVPHPDAVVVDTATRSVTCTVPLEAGQGATLASVRQGLAALKAEADSYALAVTRALNAEGEARSQGRRDGALRVCGVIEALLQREMS